jgi:hypothetical protein
MPPRGVKSNKRKRQYEHIKESAQRSGRSSGRAKEIAAATVNKQRSEAGETKRSTRKRSTKALKRFSNRPCTDGVGHGTSACTDAGAPTRAYSMDLRERELLDSDAGMKAADVAAKCRVSGSWVRLLKQRRRETGRSGPARPAARPPAPCWSHTFIPWPR